MAGLCAVSVRPDYWDKFSFEEVLFWTLFYHQHLGEEHCGFRVLDDKAENGFKGDNASGLIRPSFEKRMHVLCGTEGIGYCGNSDEPFDMFARNGRAAICFSGNIMNHQSLLARFFSSDKIFDKGDDIEIIANIVASGDDWVQGLIPANSHIKGSFSILMLTKEGIYVAVSHDSRWPMIIGRKEGAVIVACESTGFSNLGIKIERDMKPGEIVLLKGGDYKSFGLFNNLDTQICKFLWVYTAYPSATIWNLPVSLVRKRLGAIQAKRDIKMGLIPDVVSFVPDSGRYHGLGYFEEYCKAANSGEIKRVPFLDMPLQKYPYAGRSYTPSCQRDRDKEAHFKIVANAERYDGKVLVLLEDSVVRGTQIKGNLVPKLRNMGFKEIHIRASNPELLSYCPWGKSTQPGETLADKIPDWKERARYLGVDSVGYNTIEDLKNVFEELGFDSSQLCIDCAEKN